MLVDRKIYVEKIELLLSDTSKFQKVEFSTSYKCNKEVRHLLDMEAVLTGCLDNLLQENCITKQEFDVLKPVGSNPGVLYGLCKGHKEVQGKSPPFRPILSAIGTTTYKVSKFFVPILEEHTKNEYTLKDSFQFAEDIVNQDASLFMTSFDVESLFTNIPLDETINLCVTKMFQKKRKFMV